MRNIFTLKARIYTTEKEGKFTMKKNNEIKCPICEGSMDKYIYDYNTDEEEKNDYKCQNCGHKETMILQN